MAKESIPAEGSIRPGRFRRGKKETANADTRRLYFPGAGKKVIFCLLAVGCQSIFFSIQQQISHMLLLLVILPGLVLGVLWHLLEGPERLLGNWLNRHLGRISAGFCLFFLYLIFYIALFSLIVSYPVSLLIGVFWGSMDLVREYTLYSINMVFALAAISWFQWWRASSPAP